MRMLTAIATASLTVALHGCTSFLPQAEDQVAPLTILHWNDFHARNIPFDVTVIDTATGARHAYKVGGVANLLAYMNALGRGQEGVALLNAGDDFQGTPASGITMGRSQVELMNIIAPDAMELGNHEFDYGLDSLRVNMRRARYPLLAANLFDSTTGRSFGLSSITKHYGAVKVGIIGLLPTDLPILTVKGTLAGTHMMSVDSIVSNQIKRLKLFEKVTLIVVLSHLGFGNDTALAMRRSDIDIIIGGHSHTPLFQPVKKNRTIICQAGNYGRFLGKLDMIVDLKGDSILSYAGRLYETRLGVYPIDSTAGAKALEFERLVDTALSEVIGTLSTDWKRSATGESNVGNWESDVMRTFTGADIAFMNSGSLRTDIPAGTITKRQIWEMNPFSNTLVTFSVNGEMLLRMLEWQADGKGELMQVSGLTYAFDTRIPPDATNVIRAEVGGKPLDRQRQYTVVTNNFVGGHLSELLGVPAGAVNVNELNTIDRDLMIQYIQQQKTVSSKVEGRITRIQAKD